MVKTAIFVEGQTELIFVREYLLKLYGYNGVEVACFTLFTDGSRNSTEYPYQCPTRRYISRSSMWATTMPS